MAQFFYIKQDGSKGFLEAANANAALGKLPGDAAPTSGVGKVTTPTPAKTLPSAEETQTTLPTLEQKEDPVERFTNFNAALNRAVSVAREQRQDKNLDFVSSQVPVGSVSAGTFTGLLSDLNRSFDREAIPLAESAVDFAAQESTRVESRTNDIRNLKLSLIDQGAKPEEIRRLDGFLANGDIDGAMNAAAEILQGRPKAKDFDIRTVKNQIIGIDKETGESTVLFSGGGGGDGVSGLEGLVGDGEEAEGGDFALAKEYASTFQGSNEELKQDLLQHAVDENGKATLTVSQINSIVSARPTTKQESAGLRSIAISWVKGSLETRKGLDAEGELSIAIGKALDIADIGRVKYEGGGSKTLSAEEIKEVKRLILFVTINDLQ